MLKRILVVVSGSIAAYKSADIVRRFRDKSIEVVCILTAGGSQFTTALTLQSVSENPVYQDLFSLNDENEMGHIRLGQEADAILVAPASANIIANMANGFSNDLACATLLASNKPVIIAPSMNIRMWEHPATCENIRVLKTRGVRVLGPGEGEMACGEYGIGRMLEPEEIVDSVVLSSKKLGSLDGLKALVTSGPTYEPIDVIRFIGNRSSGKQGHAIADALSKLGAKTKLITGPTNEPIPPGVKPIFVETAEEMLQASISSLPADIIICAAAVSDWRARKRLVNKMKKGAKNKSLELELTENPDILANLVRHKKNSGGLSIGFAAESDNLLSNAKKKLLSKGCDWIIANDISVGSKNIGGEKNKVYLISKDSVDPWPLMTKQKVASRLALLISQYFEKL